MNTSENKPNRRSPDPIDRLIHEDNLRINTLLIIKKMDLLVAVMNNSMLIRVKLSSFPQLKKASQKQLGEWKLSGRGTGVRWEGLDEDISARGLIKLYINNQLKQQFHHQGDGDFVLV
jgi:hypothetical protein